MDQLLEEVMTFMYHINVIKMKQVILILKTVMEEIKMKLMIIKKF